jgi:hypothetical protein
MSILAAGECHLSMSPGSALRKSGSERIVWHSIDPSMKAPIFTAALTAALATAAMRQRASAQTPAPETGPKVGELAPEFAAAGATRYGLLKGPVRLSDYKGETVVLAFFFKARTRG